MTFSRNNSSTTLTILSKIEGVYSIAPRAVRQSVSG
jgi:hypothetical protein